MTEELLPDEGMDSLEDLEKNEENGLDVEPAVDALEVDRQGPTSSDVSSQETNMEEPALPHGTVSDSPQADDTADHGADFALDGSVCCCIWLRCPCDDAVACTPAKGGD